MSVFIRNAEQVADSDGCDALRGRSKRVDALLSAVFVQCHGVLCVSHLVQTLVALPQPQTGFPLPSKKQVCPLVHAVCGVQALHVAEPPEATQ